MSGLWKLVSPLIRYGSFESPSLKRENIFPCSFDENFFSRGAHLRTIHYCHVIHGVESVQSANFTQILTEISMIQHIYNLFQEYSTLDSPDISPGRTQLDTNRTNRTRSSGGKYESARFWGPAKNFTLLSIKKIE